MHLYTNSTTVRRAHCGLDAGWRLRYNGLTQPCEQTPPAMRRTSSASKQQIVAAASNGAARQALARDASMAEGVRWSSEMIAAGGGVHVVEKDDDYAIEYAPGQREQEEAEDLAALAAQESDPRYLALAAEIDALREAEDRADPAPCAEDQAARAEEADFARRAEAELAESEKSLTLYRSLCRADRAALPAIKPVHQHAGLLSNILARAMRADLAALIHARLRTIHAAITARILRAGRAVAATSAAPASLC